MHGLLVRLHIESVGMNAICFDTICECMAANAGVRMLSARLHVTCQLVLSCWLEGRMCSRARQELATGQLTTLCTDADALIPLLHMATAHHATMLQLPVTVPWHACIPPLSLQPSGRLLAILQLL